jgi:hypothetical protein
MKHQMDGSDVAQHSNFRFSTIVCDIYHFKNDKIVKMSPYVVDNIQ